MAPSESAYFVLSCGDNTDIFKCRGGDNNGYMQDPVVALSQSQEGNAHLRKVNVYMVYFIVK
jgi:hypothetical protein